MARQGHAFATADDARVVVADEGSDILRDVPADGKTLGEIVTRGNIVMKEASFRCNFTYFAEISFQCPQYFNDPVATKKAFKGGFFNTGDLAIMYPDGSVSIMDRSKDIIISGGEVNTQSSSFGLYNSIIFYAECLQLSD